MKAAYEVHNPSFRDINLDGQIAFGINDWCAEGPDGHPFFGQTKAEAEKIRDDYLNAEWEEIEPLDTREAYARCAD